MSEEKLRIIGKDDMSILCSRLTYHDFVIGTGRTFFGGKTVGALHWRMGEALFKKMTPLMPSLDFSPFKEKKSIRSVI